MNSINKVKISALIVARNEEDNIKEQGKIDMARRIHMNSVKTGIYCLHQIIMASMQKKYVTMIILHIRVPSTV